MVNDGTDKDVLQWVQSLYASASKDPFCGFTVFKHVCRFQLTAPALVSFWDATTKQTVERFVRAEDATIKEIPSGQRTAELSAGLWEVATESVIATGIIFFRCAPELYEACKAALEIDGFPVVGSLKVSGVDKGLSKAAIERSRLMKLYRTSRDTKAIMALFLYGAYKFSKDGMGQSMFPLWYTGETYEKVLDILCKECLPKAKPNGTVPVELSAGAKKIIAFPVIGVQLQHRPKNYLAIPPGLVKGSTRDEKPEVVYRVTLCWSNDAPSSSKPPGSAGGVSAGGSSSSDAHAVTAKPWH